MPMMPALGEERKVNLRGCWNRQALGSGRDPVSKNKVENIEEDT